MSDQQQACLYHPGRPVPLTDPQATLQLVATKPGSAQDSFHIWEQPLPQAPGIQCQPESGTYENHHPCTGTLPGPAAPVEPLLTGTDTQSRPGTWEGTKRYYDSEKGWIQVP